MGGGGRGGIFSPSQNTKFEEVLRTIFEYDGTLDVISKDPLC